MRKELLNILVLGLTIIISILFLSKIINAYYSTVSYGTYAITCYYNINLPSNAEPFLRASGLDSSSHAALSDNDYDYKIGCFITENNAFYGNVNAVQDNLIPIVLKLSSETNAHVGSANSDYGFNLRLKAPDPYTVSCVITQNPYCPGQYAYVASLAGMDNNMANAHIAMPNNIFNTQLCCGLITPGCMLLGASIDNSNCVNNGQTPACEPEESLSITLNFVGDCSNAQWAQTDALSTDSECSIQYSGGDIQGMNNMVTITPSDNSVTYNWNVPSIPEQCNGKIMQGGMSGLYNTSPANNDPTDGFAMAQGSFAFPGCGNGILESYLGEECDGDVFSNDAPTCDNGNRVCNSSCQVECVGCNECYDSDIGAQDVYQTPGYVNYTGDDCVLTTYLDSCNGDVLTEYNCSEDNYNTETKNCNEYDNHNSNPGQNTCVVNNYSCLLSNGMGYCGLASTECLDCDVNDNIDPVNRDKLYDYSLNTCNNGGGTCSYNTITCDQNNECNERFIGQDDCNNQLGFNVWCSFDSNNWVWDITTSTEDKNIDWDSCLDSYDNDCDSESDFDSSNNHHGDNGCPVRINNIEAPETTCINQPFTVDCNTTPGGVNSIKAEILDNGVWNDCSFVEWVVGGYGSVEGIARFSCLAPDQDSTTVKCTVDSSKSYQEGSDKTKTVNLDDCSCNSYDNEQDCEADNNCQWCDNCDPTFNTNESIYANPDINGVCISASSNCPDRSCHNNTCQAECSIDTGYPCNDMSNFIGDYCYYNYQCQDNSCGCLSSSTDYCPEPGTVDENTCYYGVRGCDPVSGCGLQTCVLSGNQYCDGVNGCVVNQCNITSVTINTENCLGGLTPACSSGENVSITINLEDYNQCLSSNYSQTDMSSEDDSCVVEFYNGDVKGVGGFLNVSSNTLTTNWTVPNIPNQCQEKTVIPSVSALWLANETTLITLQDTTTNTTGNITFAKITEQFCAWIDMQSPTIQPTYNYSCTPPPFTENVPTKECSNSSWCVFDNGTGSTCYPPGEIIKTNVEGENYSIVCMGERNITINFLPVTVNPWCPVTRDGTWFNWNINIFWPNPTGPYQGACEYPRQICYEPGNPMKCEYLISQPEYWFDPDCFQPFYENAPPPVLNQSVYGWNESCCAYEINGYPFYDYWTVQVY